MTGTAVRTGLVMAGLRRDEDELTGGTGDRVKTSLAIERLRAPDGGGGGRQQGRVRITCREGQRGLTEGTGIVLR